MADVALHAGVALGTVSNVLNKPEKVKELTRRKVMASIAELGFVRNDAARSLAAGTSNTIGIVLADLSNSLFVDIARGAEATVRQHGMNLLIANSDVDLTKQSLNISLFEQSRVAGVLLAPLDTAFARTNSVLSTTPLVLVNYASESGTYSGVVADEVHGGYEAARHLIGLGRTRLVFLGGPLMLMAVAQRLAGARAAVAESPGVTLEHIETRGLNMAHGRQAGQEILTRPAGTFDGAVAASDLLAVGAIQVLDENAGYEVPTDLAFIGYDDNHFASESAIPVSTISQHGEEMGRAAAQLLINEIHGGPLTLKRTVVIKPDLVPRRSTLGDDWRRD
ncbi:LacI family DNA-binding transcriptional regulator [Cryobacterium arcticum]|uniref:LacI family transcriptional regulator n=1 Tax=Cryobacterium arcticum TaxID=670052 RepID=A0A318A2A2_9MICO|nr:LacI family DNA-binding transcriptional regulator [Cryobacterium arcticum]PXA72098.1 LacI family transcriptional regulator [Cryobacterium arcticum]